MESPRDQGPAEAPDIETAQSGKSVEQTMPKDAPTVDRSASFATASSPMAQSGGLLSGPPPEPLNFPARAPGADPLRARQTLKDPSFSGDGALR